MNWSRDDEIASAASLFASARVKRIDLRLTYGQSYPDTAAGHEGRKVVDVTDVNLTIVDHAAGDPDSTVYLVQGQRGRFAFDVHWVDAAGDSIWRVVEWWDLGIGSGKTGGKRPTWGSLKSLFRP